MMAAFEPLNMMASLRQAGTYGLRRLMIPLCLDQGVGVLPYSPLARGLSRAAFPRPALSSPPASAAPPVPAPTPLADELYAGADRDVVEALHGVASGLGLPPARLALAWLLSNKAVAAPIVGATKLTHPRDAVAAVDVTLSAAEVRRLESAYRPHPVAGPE
jgi:aryl-alcohol dehydrogenase-like predicted oxidoreductase